MKTDSSTLPPGTDRLERAIARLGLASRREAKALILAGVVSVNGKVIKATGHAVLPTDTITLKGISTAKKESVLLYKPRGIETTKTLPASKDIKDKFPKLAHLSPIGRLDKESEGLIILTNDGTLTRALTKENSSVEKEYEVTVRENIPDAALLKMSRGIMLSGQKTKPATASRLSRHSFSIILKEGRKHQIRRMCAACNLTVESLVRIRIGHLTKGAMKPGHIKKVTEQDIVLFKKS